MSREYDIEEDFHAQDSKKWRKMRKEKKARDQSKYKKTDLRAIPKPKKPLLPKGRVIAIVKEGIWVDSGQTRFLATLKGQLKKEKKQAKNLVAVGDFVRFTKDLSISHIDERHSFLARTDVSGKKEQLIAVNVDQAVIVVSVVSPNLKPALVDRYLTAAEKGNIHPIIVINKIDLLEENEKKEVLYRQFLTGYEKLGFPILSISAQKFVGLDSLRELLRDKVSVFSGQSGVGKSSMLNACFGLTLKTGELAQKTAKGSHTTTQAELLSLPDGGYCVDTPGVQSFGIWNLSLNEVVAHFHDLQGYGCKYHDCTHISEPDCAVVEALKEGKISRMRFESYRSLLNEAKGGPDNRRKIKEKL